MKKSLTALLAVCALFAGGCTVVKINKGDTNSITHAPGQEKNLTNRAYRKTPAHASEQSPVDCLSDEDQRDVVGPSCMQRLR